jgi:hypothetical protein
MARLTVEKYKKTGNLHQIINKNTTEAKNCTISKNM